MISYIYFSNIGKRISRPYNKVWMLYPLQKGQLLGKLCALHYYSNCICTANSPGFRPRLRQGRRNVQGRGDYVPHQFNPIAIRRGWGIISPLHRLAPPRFSIFWHPCTIQNNSRRKVCQEKKCLQDFFITQGPFGKHFHASELLSQDSFVMVI